MVVNHEILLDFVHFSFDEEVWKKNSRKNKHIRQFGIPYTMTDYKRMQKVIEKTRFHLLSYVASRPTFDFPAVYLIYNPSKNVVYIGQTKTLYERANEHLKGNDRYAVSRKIKRFPKMSQKIEKYYIKYIRIDDYRERCFSECILLGVHQPILNYIN